MSKKTAPIVWGIGAVLLLVAIVVLANQAGLFYGGAVWQGAVVSLNSIIIQSSSDKWTEMTMQGNVVFNGQGQSVIGESIPGGVQTLLEGTDYESKQDLKIDFNMDGQLIRYATKIRQTKLYTTKIKLDPTRNVEFGGDQFACFYIGRSYRADQCISGTDLYIACGNYGSSLYAKACKAMGGVPAQCSDGGSRQCLFIETTEKANVYNLQTPTKEWITKFTMTSGGKSETLTTSDSQPTAMGSNLAITYNGLTSTAEKEPAENTAMMVWLSGSTMKVVSYADEPFTKTLVKTNYEWQMFSSPDDNTAKPYQEIASQVNSMNSQVNSIVSNTPPSAWTQSARPVIVSLTSVIIDASNKPYYYPWYTFYTKAKWLGIYVPVSKPVVAKLNMPAQVKSGDYASVTAEIRNDGSQGTIDAILTCDLPIQITSGSSYRLSGMNQGETRMAYYTITTAVNAQQQGKCTIVAKDAQDPSIASQPVSGTTSLIPLPSAQCGNGICEPPTESQATCSQDCKEGQIYCEDGTISGQCSKNKPFFCNTNGYLVPQAGACGCPTGLVAKPDGTCHGGSSSTPGGEVIPPQDYTLLIVAGIGALVLIGVYAITRRKK